MSDQNIYQIDQILLSFVRLDQVKIDEIVSYDPSKQLLVELIQIFDKETTSTVSQIKSELENNNYYNISRLAHRLRSTSSNLGAIRLNEILKRLEYLTQDSNVIRSEVEFLITATAKESAFASKSLHAYLAERDT